MRFVYVAQYLIIPSNILEEKERVVTSREELIVLILTSFGHLAL